jgi:hypothetical protein
VKVPEVFAVVVVSARAVQGLLTGQTLALAAHVLEQETDLAETELA